MKKRTVVFALFVVSLIADSIIAQCLMSLPLRGRGILISLRGMIRALFNAADSNVDIAFWTLEKCNSLAFLYFWYSPRGSRLAARLGSLFKGIVSKRAPVPRG